MPAPSHQMPAGAQVAFARKWLESQNIESQTIDVLAHIDSSLSYEENIKSMKRQLGLGGGRSRQPAVRGLTAAECDVAIGNFEAGFNHEVTRDACKCGHPEACEKIEQDRREKSDPGRSEVAWQAAQAEQRAAAARKTAAIAKTPKLKTMEDVEQWMKQKAREYGSKNEFACSSEYEKMYPTVKRIYDQVKKQKKEERKRVKEEQKRVNIVKNPYGAGYVIKYRYRENAYVGGGGPMGMGADIATFETVDQAAREAKRRGLTVVSKPKAKKPALIDENVALRRSEGRNLARQEAAAMAALTAPAPNLPPALTAPPELAADVLGAEATPAAPKRKPATRKTTKKVPYFTISKAKRLVAENFAHRSDKQIHTDIIKLRDYIRYIEIGDKETLIRGGYFKQVVHPDASGVSPVDIFLHQNLKYTLKRAYAEKDKRKQATPAAPKRKPAARKPKTKVAAAPKPKPKATKPKAKKTAAAQKLTAAQREHLAIQGFVMVRRGGKYVKITR